MMEFILARHGETEWNVKRVFRGRRDMGLSEMGLKQAALLGRYLAEVELDAIYSSPLRRALETENQIAENQPQKIEVNVTEGLLDLSYGKWEGMSEEEVKGSYGALYREWQINPQKVKIPGGEGLADVRGRALKVIDEAVSRYEGSVLLVSHRVVNKVLICALLGLDDSHFWNVKMDVGGITTFEYNDGRFTLIKHNDTSYLREIQKRVLDDF